MNDLADKIASAVGTWRFVLVETVVIAVWILINVKLNNGAFDQYPFVFLNLILACVSAYTAPIIMMSQNKQEIRDKEQQAHDRKKAESDYKINKKSEQEVAQILEYLSDHQEMLKTIEMHTKGHTKALIDAHGEIIAKMITEEEKNEQFLNAPGSRNEKPKAVRPAKGSA